MTETQHRPGSFCTSVLHTRDLARATAFYERLFGWHAIELPGARGVVRLAIGGRVVAHARLLDGRHDAWVPHVLVEDIDTTATLAVAEGASVHERTGLAGLALVATLTDREGASFGLWQPAPDTGAAQADTPGSLWWIELLSNDVDEATHFYGRVFEWQSRPTAFVPFDRYIVFERDGQQEGGLLPIGEGWEVSPCWNTIVSVGDADEAGRLATALGGCVHFVHTVPTAGRIAVLGDPGGAVFVVRGPVPSGPAL
jgi:uncharacterized protein